MSQTDVAKDYPDLDPQKLVLRPRPAVNIRSILVGAIGVILICGFTPFNDYVLNNTPLIGGSLPLAVVLFFFLFAVLVNGPLSRLAPRAALGSHEMAVVLCMLLVACVLPAAGLMQYWPASIVGPWRHVQDNPKGFDDLLRKLNLPSWFWTSFPADAPSTAERGADDIVTKFYGRIPDDWPFWSTFWSYLTRWFPPILGWGVFFIGIFGALLGMGFVVRKQWVENERITFPIAQVEMALVESPSPGKYLNSTFSARAFWVGLLLMVFLRGLNGLYQYFPKYIPNVELKYDLSGVFSEPPWSYIQYIPYQTLYPLIAALIFFVSTRIAFSLWATFAIWQIPNVYAGVNNVTFYRGHGRDTNGGALLAFVLMILWTGRHHYLRVIKLMFAPKGNTPETRDFIHYRTAGWIALGGAALSVAWLLKVGMSPAGALLFVAGLLLTWLVMAYVVAHSGFPLAVTLSGPREWFLDIFTIPNAKSDLAIPNIRNHFHVQVIGGNWAYARDQLLTYTTHGLRVATEFAPKAGRRLLAAMALALLLGYAVSQGSTLLCYYKYSNTQDKKQQTPINAEVLDGQPKWTMAWMMGGPNGNGVKPQHETWKDYGWFAGSFLVTSLLAVLQLRYSWWPLHPIGVLMLFAYSMRRLWFSIFVGWLAKMLVVKFGGGGLFKAAKPFFIGIIVGEVVAAGLFALTAVLLHMLGVQYEVVQFLPTTQF